MSILFRIEHPDGLAGMWYDKSGQFDGLILRLDNAKSRDLPMEFDPEYHAGGKHWYSACDSLDEMRNWFNTKDVVALNSLGYELYKFEVSRYRQYSGHAIFTRRDIVSTALLDTALLA